MFANDYDIGYLFYQSPISFGLFNVLNAFIFFVCPGLQIIRMIHPCPRVLIFTKKFLLLLFVVRFALIQCLHGPLYMKKIHL